MEKGVITRIYRFYLDGFRGMTTGKTLWTIILIKLFILFFILKLFFFPNFLKRQGTDAQKSEYVSGELVDRASD